MPDSAPVAVLTSSLSQMVPVMLSLTVVFSPARSNSAATRCTRSLMPPSGSPISVSLPCTPARTTPGARNTPPT